MFIFTLAFVVTVLGLDFTQCDFANTTEQRVQWLDEILIETQKTLAKHNATTWAVQSTLLGIVRDKRTMPWTWDVDIQTFTSNIPSICQNNSKVRLELQAKGYRIYHCFDNFARVCKAKQKDEPTKYISTGEPVESRLDIYGATKRSDGLYDVVFSPCKWDLDRYLLPVRPYTWEEGKKAIIGPNNYDYFLQMAYGANWTVPIKYGGGRDDFCVYTK